MSEPKEQRTSIMEMDGSEHQIPGEENCFCGSFGKKCPKCGGFAHYQPVYGSFYYECEKCHYQWT